MSAIEVQKITKKNPDQSVQIIEGKKQMRMAFEIPLQNLSLDISHENLETLKGLAESFRMFFAERPADSIPDATVRRKALKVLAFADFSNRFKNEIQTEFSQPGKYKTDARDLFSMPLGRAYSLAMERNKKDESPEEKATRKEVKLGFSRISEKSETFGEELQKVREQRTYRTRGCAETDTRFIEVPGNLKVITKEGFQLAITPSAGKSGQYLAFYDYKGEELGNDGSILRADPQKKMYFADMFAKKPVTELDAPFLNVVFSAIYDEFEKSSFSKFNETISFYVPEFLQRTLTDSNKKPASGISDLQIASFLDKIKSYHNVAGIVTRNGRESIYPVLNFSGYDGEKNVISVQSPYLCRVVSDLREASVKKDKKGQAILEGGKEVLEPHISELVHTSIDGATKNKLAIGIVLRCVQTIEMAGPKNLPHISAETLVEEVPGFKERLNAQKNKRRLLQKTFSKAWELIRTHTDLQKKYMDIALPDPDNPAHIPNISTLKKTVFEFPHNGTVKDWNKL